MPEVTTAERVRAVRSRMELLLSACGEQIPSVEAVDRLLEAASTLPHCLDRDSLTDDLIELHQLAKGAVTAQEVPA